MTTQPKPEKPKRADYPTLLEYVRAFVAWCYVSPQTDSAGCGDYGVLALVEHFTYLDEQHAAGQVPVAAGAPRDGHKQDMSRCRCSAPEQARDGRTCLNCGDHLPSAPVAAPPAQPLHPYGGLCTCQHASDHSLPHEPHCAGYKQPAQPAAVETRCKCGHAKVWHVGPGGVGLGSGPACHCGCDCFEAAEPAVPVAGEPNESWESAWGREFPTLVEKHKRDQLSNERAFERAGFKYGFLAAAKQRDAALSQVKAEKSESERLTNELVEVLGQCNEAREYVSKACLERDAALKSSAESAARVDALTSAARLALAWFDQDGSVGMSEEAMAPLRGVVFAHVSDESVSACSCSRREKCVRDNCKLCCDCGAPMPEHKPPTVHGKVSV